MTEAHGRPRTLLRTLVKQALGPLRGGRVHSHLQAAAMAYDIVAGRWYEPELELIHSAVREGETAIDVGANYGLYAYHLAHAVGATGRVFAFEPVPFTASTFRRVKTLLRLERVELIEAGCGDVGGRVVFTLPITQQGTVSAGLASMGRDDSWLGVQTVSKRGYREVEHVSCPVVRLDDALPSLDALSLIKCDVEGAELLAFRGAQRTLEIHRPTVICETNPWQMRGFGVTPAELGAFFDGLGYGAHRLTGGRLEAIEATNIVDGNTIFLHPSRASRFRRWTSAQLEGTDR